MNIQQENMLSMTQASAWCEENLGNRVNRSTIHRWRTSGARGVKLETILIGGRRYTSSEAMQRFFAETTATDGESATVEVSSNDEADRYLESEGF